VKLRRTLALGLAGLAAAAALTACGFNYPTDRINNVTEGANYRDGTVDILNAVVVSKEANAGTFIATFVNNGTEAVTLQSISGDNTAVGQVSLTQPLSVPANGLVNLASTQGFPLAGTFAVGDFVTLTFQFDDGSTVPLEVPVVLDDEQWAGLDVSTESPSATDSPTASGSPPTASPSATESTSASPTG
jgi:copper(I)-binding protein